MNHYVLGFLFNKHNNHVLLVEKTRGPEILHGKWNGIGGKMEPGETHHQAIVREFSEECPFMRGHIHFTGFGVMRDTEQGWTVYLYRTNVEVGHNPPKTVWQNDVGEKIKWHDVWDLETGGQGFCQPGVVHNTNEGAVPIVYNLAWLLPMAATPGIMVQIDETKRHGK